MAPLLLAVVAAFSVPTPSPTISPLPSPVVQWYARQGALASGLDVSLVRAVIDSESGGDPRAVSKAGAVGIMQLAADTAGDCGIRDRYDPQANVECGAKTLAYLVHRYGVETGIAAYNFGAGNVEAAGGHLSKMPDETKAYVRSVIDDYDDLQHAEVAEEPPAPPGPLPAAQFDAQLERARVPAPDLSWPLGGLPQRADGYDAVTGRTMSQSPDDGGVNIPLRGEYDLSRKAELDAALHSADATEKPIVVDLRGVRYIDSTVVNALVQLRRRHPTQRIVLSGAYGNVRRVLELTGLGAHFEIT